MFNTNGSGALSPSNEPSHEAPRSQEGVVGEVKWFNNQKGYGFIVFGEHPDIFVHHSAIKMDGYRTLKQGGEVRFDLVVTDKGLQAHNVTPI